jgi:hypothetical protein
MHIKTTSGSGGSALGIIGTGLALALPEAKWIGWTLVAIGLLVFVFDVHIERGQLAVGSTATLKQRFRRMWPQYLMVVCGMGFFVGLVAFLQLNVRPPAQEETKNVSSPKDPTDLFYYFVHDFNFASIDRTAMIRAQGPSGLDQTVEVKIRLFRDFGSNSEFMAAFVPFFGDVKLVAITEQFIDSLKSHIKQAREDAKLIGMRVSDPGSPVSSSEDLVFSGRVFLYTLNSLDAVQTGHLVESYRKDGMFLEIRGGNFLFFRNQQRH